MMYLCFSRKMPKKKDGNDDAALGTKEVPIFLRGVNVGQGSVVFSCFFLLSASICDRPWV